MIVTPAAMGTSPLDARLLPIYAGAELRLAMTLRHLKWVAAIAPIAIIATLEIVRGMTIGHPSWPVRLTLDAVVAGAFILFGAVMVRAVNRMHERLKRQNQELLALHGAGLDVSSELALDSVLDKVVERARTLVGARYGALSVVNTEGRIESFLTSGISKEVEKQIGPPPTGHGVLGVVLREGQHLRLEDIAKHPRSQGFPANHPVMKTLLAVPISCKSPFLGNLYLSEKTDGQMFTEDDEQTLERFAVQAGIAIDNAHLHQQVTNLAIAQERLRIAHEMHDGLAQVLGYVNTKVQAATEYIRRSDTEEAMTQLRELASAAREAYGDARQGIVDLRTLPGPERSFPDVVRDYVVRWKEQSGISTQLTLETGFALPPGAELQLIRLIQEALANVRKHSKATSVSIDLHRRGAELVVTVSDNGVGFNPAARQRSEFPRFGLSTMKERVESIRGTLTIQSTPGSGTMVRAEIPLT
ncbi:MAG TPA: GAF domain-containing sensor histidine kinase [Thermoanaerobaculia bacterium]|nr:GAF domain-containing sensor histidine kinase [Thermoanaerobaculia bacterium]